MTGRLPTVLSLMLITGPCLSVSPAQQPVAPDAGCMQHKGEYTCNWSSFTVVFDRARTVAINASTMDRSTATQLRKLIAELGKTPVTEGTADLTFAVSSAPAHGVDFGPGDHDLARLRVYAPSSASEQGVLLWAETYRGQGDRPWPAEVHALLAQFQDRFPPHN